MSTGGSSSGNSDDRADNTADTLLDRMEYIAEVEDEDDDEFLLGDDEDSIEVERLFGRDSPDGDQSDDTEDDDDDDEDYDGDEATPLEYHWTPHANDEIGGGGPDNNASMTDFQFSGLSLNADEMTPQSSIVFDSENCSSEDSSSVRFAQTHRRGSFSAPRRQSSTRFSFGSAQSAPTTRELSPKVAAKRRVTISVPSGEANNSTSDHGGGSVDSSSNGGTQSTGRLSRQHSKRRQSVSLKSMTGAATVAESEESSTSSSKGGFLSRKSTRRTSGYAVSVVAAKTSSVFDSMDTAISTLGQGGNSEWENVAAAAAVVAAGTAGSGKRSHVQFAVDEKVLVFLNILNHTNSVDSMDAFTVNPVNKYGYPRGEGKTNDEQQGPYVYVLASVKKVHFDEDLRYYTVARADSGAEQRADTAWMEQVKSPAAVDAATRAARQTSRSEFEKETSEKEDKPSWIAAGLSWPVDFAKNTVVPLIRKGRLTAKEQIAFILYGSSPYSCKIRATGINLLVLCSFVYLFLEVIALAFLPASADFAVAIITVIVWSILSIELLLEYIIRPPDYFELIQSERAYAPSTARNIDSFHLFFEMLSLIIFIPEFVCLHKGPYGKLVPFSGLWASVRAVLGPTKWESAIGRFCIGLRVLRMFSLARHWKKMWINNTFRDETRGRLLNLFMHGGELDRDRIAPMLTRKKKNKVDDEESAQDTLDQKKMDEKASNEEDQRLKKAATIGTSLMVVNSHRALFLLSVIVIVLPMIRSIQGVNSVADKMTDLLQQNNIDATNCEHLEISINSWVHAAAMVQSESPTNTDSTYVLWAQISPSPRGCDFLNGTNGVITRCTSDLQIASYDTACSVWEDAAIVNPDVASPAYFADKLNIRQGGLTEFNRSFTGPLNGNFSLDNLFQREGEIVTFTVRVLYNQNHTIAFTNISNFLLLLSSLILCLFGLAVLRGDAGRLVLHPLQRMLKIVVRYAENPLSNTVGRKTRYKKRSSKQDPEHDDDYDSDSGKDGDKEQLGNYETEQLINAISKIADLLRKCWGVAGAGIISSNLARTQDGKTVVFNPTVAGRQVYALFGFVTINGFSDQLRALDRDVMILINDVAGVVHDEVYRWALGDSGQCNKNLGSSFLMVFRIGDFKEVHEKQARATDVVFSSNEKRAKKNSNLRRRKQQQGVHHGRGGRTATTRATKNKGRGGDTLQLASLPGIQAFSDRALLGMLKSFAGIHRERELTKWKRDFRLGAGVGAYVVNIIIGMDAGWAVEGAVGSEYKIDATYLSPHVNMAARMMSATKQYGVTILLSQAVEELLSGPARTKLRHLDTVYVKGSSVSQRIFTYDARHSGVDFFLFERSPEQADLDAESYTPMIWENDQDLRAMRQHVTDDFARKFKEGKDLYLSGEWNEAITILKDADDIMITTVLEEGYIDYNPDDIDGRIFDRRNKSEEILRLRADLGDGGCKCLIAFMEKRNGIPPDDWKGVRPLTSK